MATGDIYKIFIKFRDDPIQGKERFAVEIGKSNLIVVLLNSITSQYDKKSEQIKLQYYPIKDWGVAGLAKPSYIDILSTMQFDFQKVMQLGTYVGQLSLTDVEQLFEFIKSYPQRLENFKSK